MDKDASETMILEHASQTGMTPTELTRKTLESLGTMPLANFLNVLPMQINKYAETSRQLSLLQRFLQQQQDLRKRMENGSRPDLKPNWDEIFADPAVLASIDGCPSNDAPYYDAVADERILDNAKRNAPWFNRIMREVMAKMENES